MQIAGSSLLILSIIEQVFFVQHSDNNGCCLVELKHRVKVQVKTWNPAATGNRDPLDLWGPMCAITSHKSSMIPSEGGLSGTLYTDLKNGIQFMFTL
jgi:hypothetical protein